MTFAEARAWVAAQALGRPYTIAYHELHHSSEGGGRVSIECAMTILDRHGEHRHIQAYNQPSWEAAVATMSAQLCPQQAGQEPQDDTTTTGGQ